MGYCFIRQAVLIPGVVLGDATTALGGFAPGSDVHWYQAFAWELITTFILVFVVFSVALSEPNFGDVGPLIVGLTVTASAFVGESLCTTHMQAHTDAHTPIPTHTHTHTEYCLPGSGYRPVPVSG
jgi:glycerol uptake facilitator-like aquaporin